MPPRILLSRADAGGLSLVVAGRDGRPLDSLRLDDPRLSISGLSADGRHVLVSARRAGTQGEFDLLAYPASSGGRIGSEVDTVLRQLRMTVTAAPNGMLLNVSGPTDYEVWIMRRDGPASMRFTQRRLAAGTSRVGGGRPVRLGTPPRALDASFRMSSDGRTVVARVASPE